MAERVPSPRILDGFQVIFAAFNEERTELVEAAELTWTTWTTLKPDDDRNAFITEGEIKSLPERVVDSSRSFGKIPVHIFKARV